MTYRIKPMTDEEGYGYWLLYQDGRLTEPIALIPDYEMHQIAKKVLGGVSMTGIDLRAGLKKYRRANELTLRDVETKTGVSASTLSRIENGEANITQDVYTKLVAVIGEPAPANPTTEARP